MGGERAGLLENYEWCEVGAGTQIKGGVLGRGVGAVGRHLVW